MDLYMWVFWAGIFLVFMGMLGLELGDHIGVETFSIACLLVSFGGCGRISGNLLLTIAFSVIFTAIIHFLVVVPMRRVQNSASVSQTSLIGRMAIVTVPIPEKGYGEILMTGKLDRQNQIAVSFDHVPIGLDDKVVVVEIVDGVFSVAKLDQL